MIQAIFFLLPALAIAGKQADRPKFKIGDSIKAQKEIYSYSGYCPDPLKDKDGKQVFPPCYTSKKIQPYAGKMGKIVSMETRTCASDVGRYMLNGMSEAEINRIRASWGGEPIEPGYDKKRLKDAAELMAIDSCDDYRYMVDFGKLGVFLLSERDMRKK